MDAREALLEIKKRITEPGGRGVAFTAVNGGIDRLYYVKPDGELELIIDFDALIKENMRRFGV